MVMGLDAIEARLAAATPGQWSRVRVLGSKWWTLGLTSNHIAVTIDTDANWELVEHAPTDLTALCAEVRRLRERLLQYEDSKGGRLDRQTWDVIEAEMVRVCKELGMMTVSHDHWRAQAQALAEAVGRLTLTWPSNESWGGPMREVDRLARGVLVADEQAGDVAVPARPGTT